MSDITKTPREELECKKKYLYEYSMFWECNDGSKCQILEDDVCELLNEQQANIENLRKWLIAEQKQVEKRDAFIKQKGLMSEFVKELEDEWETI